MKKASSRERKIIQTSIVGIVANLIRKKRNGGSCGCGCGCCGGSCPHKD
jgi:hypothetical protein